MHASIDGFVMLEPGRVEEVASGLRLLADPALDVYALAQGETNPIWPAELTGIGIPAASQYLDRLQVR
jgi:hypothetical protein